MILAVYVDDLLNLLEVRTMVLMKATTSESISILKISVS